MFFQSYDVKCTATFFWFTVYIFVYFVYNKNIDVSTEKNNDIAWTLAFGRGVHSLSAFWYVLI